MTARLVTRAGPAALLAALLAALAACDSSVVRIGAPDSPSAQAAAHAMVRELGDRGRASHVVSCETPERCAAELLADELELVIVDRVSAEAIPGDVVLADTGLELRPRLIVSASSPLESIDELAARSVSPRIVVSRRLLQRARHGFAALARAYGMGRSERIVIDDVALSLAALDQGRCDAVLIEEAAIVGRYRALADPRGALASVPYSVVAVRDDAMLRAAAGALAARIASRALEPLVIAAPATPEASHAVNAAARGLVARPHELITSAAPLALLRSGQVSIALAPEAAALGAGAAAPGGEASEDSAVEAVVTYDRGQGVAMTVWQRAGGALGRPEAEALLAASHVARMPDPSLPSLWKRRPPTRPREDAARPWLDSLVNVLVVVFVIWLAIAMFRRERPGMFDEMPDDS